MLDGMDFVCFQNSDIDFGYQFGNPTLSIEIGRFNCKISEEGYSRTFDFMDYIFV